MKLKEVFTKVRVVRVLCAAALLALPHNLFLKHFLPESYQHGLLIDYLIPKWFISDFLLIPLASWALFDFLQNIRSWSKTTVIMTTGVLILTLRVLLLSGGEVVWWWFGLLASFITGWWLSQNWAKPVWEHWLLPTTLTLTLVIQALFANYQWYTQHSFAPYYVFGETNISAPYGLLTITTETSGEKVLPYGTTAHPNILAGTAVLIWCCLFWWYLQQTKQTKYLSIMISVSSVSMLSLLALTDSVSANLSLLLAGFVSSFLTYKNSPASMFSLSKKLLLITIVALWLSSVFFFFIPPQETLKDSSIIRRSSLLHQALQTVHSPIQLVMGTGWGTTLKQTAANPTRDTELTRFIQPVHHAPLLWVIETGVIGGLIVCLLFKKMTLKQTLLLLVVTPTLAFDHYWLSNHQSWWLLFLLFY